MNTLLCRFTHLYKFLLNIVLVRGSNAMIKTHDQKQLEEKKFYFSLQSHNTAIGEK